MTLPPLRFGAFELDVAARELRRDDERIELPSSAFDGLVYLIRHRDRAVGRDELMAAIWGRADVADSLLGQTLVRLRRALGDSGDTQQWIRTVPRFGYRWIGAVEEAPPRGHDGVAAHAVSATEAVAETLPPADGASLAAAADAATPDAAPPSAVTPLHTATPSNTATPLHTATPSHTATPPAAWRWQGVAATLVVALAALLLFLALSVRRGQQAAGVDAAPAVDTAAATAPALVLPARVDAGEEWAWLRLGLMDLIASRLRRGDLPTASSESVVALLRERRETDPAALLDAPDLAAPATLRVLPEIELRHGQWRVRLRAQDRDRRIDIETRAGDAMSAAREAADTLLLRLGHLPPPSHDETPQDLAELLQRSRAAMLADQLELAGELIRRADPALRARPEITLREAQIELRAGDYLAVERHLTQLLDTLPASRDPELRGRALVTLAASYIRRERPQDAAPNYEEAIALLRGQKAPDALGLALLGRGLIATLRGDYDAALADLGLARSETEAAGNALGTAQVDLNLGLIEVRRLRPATALPALTDAAARFQRLGAQEEYVFTIASIAEVQQLLLDHAGALATTQRYWPPEAHSQNLRLRHKLAQVRAEALLETGQLAAAAALIDGLLAHADADLDAVTVARAQVVRARIAAARGDAPAAARLAGAALTPVLANSDAVRYVQAWMLRLRQLRLAGDAAAAPETGQLRDWVQAHADPWRLAYASLAEAEQRAAGSDAESALPLFDQTLRQLDAAGAIPDDVVEAIAPYVALLVKTGRLDAARALSARVAPWSDHDLRAAGVFVRIHTALGRTDAREAAERRARALAGERPLP